MREDIPALSLREPWLYAIQHMGKPVENRTWATKYRGRIRLHAARTFDWEGWVWIRERFVTPPTEARMKLERRLGAYLGEVTVTDCVPRDDLEFPEDHPNVWAFGPICWLLADPVWYPAPIPGRGYPGLYFPERFGKAGRER